MEYNVDKLSLDCAEIKKHYDANKARVLRHRDMVGRPVIYIPAKNHNVNDRNIDELTKFIVYCLVGFSLDFRMWICKNFTKNFKELILFLFYFYRKKHARNAFKTLLTIFV